MNIPITCKGSGEIPLEKLQNFQGNLKSLDQKQFDKLKRSILKHGFSFPVFVWEDNVLDGHQRAFVTRHLIEQEGCSLDGDIPVVEIQAKDRKEAGEKLLALNSQFAKITGEGLNEFLHDLNIDIAGLADDLELPDIDIDKFLEGWAEGQAPGEPNANGQGGVDDTYTRKIVAPIYEPKGDRPPVKELVDREKTATLIDEIEDADLPDEVAGFLKVAAERHSAFHFRKIAEFYCHADEKTQELMEKSGLVIIDFKKAIEYGFVHMTEKLGELADLEGDNDGDA